MKNFEKIFILFADKYKFKIGKTLGKGGFGEVKEMINQRNKVYAAKIVKQKKKIKQAGSDSEGDQKEKDNIILNLKNPNIVQIHKIYDEEYAEDDNKKETYNLIVMEKAVLKDLKTFIKSLYNQNIDNFINQPFNDVVGNHLLQFFCLQIVNGLEYLERNELIHFDIKPENILIFLNLALKLSDFGLLKEVSQMEKIRIPGGTPGYLSPEYYQFQRNKVSIDIAKKQDYYALGVTIYFIKYGKQMIKLKIEKSDKEDENRANQEYIVDTLQKKIIFIKSDKLADKDFIKFLCSLIQIDPDDRPFFEEIYRNKWLNKNVNSIKKVLNAFKYDEPKLIDEFRKKDYLIEKKKELTKKREIKKFIFIPKKKGK